MPTVFIEFHECWEYLRDPALEEPKESSLQPVPVRIWAELQDSYGHHFADSRDSPSLLVWASNYATFFVV